VQFSAGTAVLLALIGLGVGAFGTLIGAGGGFILTPILLLLYPHDSAQTLTAISLAAVFFNAASGTTAYARQRRIDYRNGVVFALATLPGGDHRRARRRRGLTTGFRHDHGRRSRPARVLAAGW
jgi:uncharacterized protein